MIAFAFLVAATSHSNFPSDATPLKVGTSLNATVEANGWRYFYSQAEKDDESIMFEIVAQTTLPTALAVYVTDGYIQQLDGAPSQSDTFRGPASGTAALDSDTVSHIGNGSTRHYYVYVGQCYLMKGSQYLVSVLGASSTFVPFSISAIRKKAKLGIPSRVQLENRPFVGTVCDNKYIHHFWDVPAMPHRGALELTFRKKAGELDAFYVRHERCAGPIGTNLVETRLFGRGLATSKIQLPSADADLAAGRYYVTVRGAVEFCGDYEITLTNLTLPTSTLASGGVARG
jgi:hypothetical protein